MEDEQADDGESDIGGGDDDPPELLLAGSSYDFAGVKPPNLKSVSIRAPPYTRGAAG